ncbi:hypothetical protein CLOM_g7763, partial [Closterium sp. NIES-68]
LSVGVQPSLLTPGEGAEGGEWACAGLPLTACHQLAVFADGCPKQARFERLRQSMGSFFAFHGSATLNWFSILRNGVFCMTATPYMSSEPAFGPGIYFTSNLNFALSRTSDAFSARQFQDFPGSSAAGPAFDSPGFRCVAICEVLHSPTARGRPDKCSPPELTESSSLLGWLKKAGVKVLRLIRHACSSGIWPRVGHREQKQQHREADAEPPTRATELLAREAREERYLNLAEIGHPEWNAFVWQLLSREYARKDVCVIVPGTVTGAAASGVAASGAAARGVAASGADTSGATAASGAAASGAAASGAAVSEVAGGKSEEDIEEDPKLQAQKHEAKLKSQEEAMRKNRLVVLEPGFEDHMCIRYLLLFPNDTHSVVSSCRPFGTTDTSVAAGGPTCLGIKEGRMLIGVDLKELHVHAFDQWEQSGSEAFEQRQGGMLATLLHRRKRMDAVKE